MDTRSVIELLEEARNMIEQYNYGMADELVKMALEKLYQDQEAIKK